ncbi:histidine kinase [Kitasatospora sp. NBC_01250]|uniref:sensor histidine kinase n=1 Tax=Kitasatospora sp. NBC_01250 TaxID=2903571 RepID=UPI002E380FEE|nr:histidine kinase [Kitasatospora sp. NBC_01250]
MATRRAPSALGTRVRQALQADTLLWTRNDALLCAGAACLDLLGYTLGGSADGRPVQAAGLVLTVLAVLPLLARRRWPLAAPAAVLAVNLLLNQGVSAAPHHFGASLALALFFVARAGRIAVTLAAAPATAAVTLIGRGQPFPPTLGDASSAVVAAALVVGTAAVVNYVQREQATKRKLLADRAVARERRRIARELHDIVAHHITTMQLMAGGARANLGGDTEVVREALVTLEGSGRLALREMRQLLDVLRAGDEAEEAPNAPQPGTGDLERIVQESRLGGLPVEFTVRGEQRALAPTLGLTVFRIVQEALTNARKHAGGQAQAYVQLTYRQDRITVEVRDTGPGVPTGVGAGRAGAAGPGPGRSGYGLIGMQERVALQGGTMVAGPLEHGGFRVAASLPVAPGEREELLG